MSLRGAVPDYIYWMLFVVFTAVHYYTKTQGTPQEGLITFFIIVWLASFLVLLALKVYAREGRSEIVDTTRTSNDGTSTTSSQGSSESSSSPSPSHSSQPR